LVGLEGIRYVGNHGLELVPDADGLARAIARFRASVAHPVEDKVLSLSYHYRDAPDERAARAELEEVAERAREAGLDPRWGRKVLEVRPPVAADKGTAVRALLREVAVARALYAGDDTTDLDAFSGLWEAGLEHVVRVAVASEEGPPELREAADLVVASPEELVEVLRAL
ncbi:MAG TPA: trehalose-phosphatase, partial [Gaiellaceae bacterium]|nr:trehalose-phosphatase [Gaiellaceae bacterium]